MILRIALDTPLRRAFDYRPPADLPTTAPAHDLKPGVRVRVPFGRRRLVGVLLETVSESAIEPGKLKAALDILDQEPIFDPVTFEVLRWAADYYHHPIGEVLAAALPAPLRAGQPADERIET